jgi:hypothetical protein
MQEPFEVGARVRQKPAVPIEGDVVDSQWDAKGKTFRYHVAAADGTEYWFSQDQVEAVPQEGA